MESNQPSLPTPPPRPRWQPPIIVRPQSYLRSVDPAAQSYATPFVEPSPTVPVLVQTTVEHSAAQQIECIATPAQSFTPLKAPEPSYQPRPAPVSTEASPPVATESEPEVPKQFFPAPNTTPQQLAAAEVTKTARPKHHPLKRAYRIYKSHIVPSLVVSAVLVLLLLAFGGMKIAAFATNTHKSAVSKSHDIKRLADLQSLQSNLETYYGQHDSYPTLAELNNASFRTQNMPGLPPSALQDPLGMTASLVSMPAKHVYAYEVLPIGCNNTTTKCNEYEVAAVLDNGMTTALNNSTH
jgi:hypothetical protein